MTRKHFLFATSLLLSLTAAASPLTPQEALQRAKSDAPTRVAAKINPSVKPVYTAQSANGVSTAYIFNNENIGYVIVSADDVALPVLGYSDNGHIDPNEMSPELKYWLDEYGRQIEWAIDAGISGNPLKAPQANSEWTQISPLCKTQWDQAAPYYNQCPEYKGRRCVTGCVATSMAQLMKYHNYPEVGQGVKIYKATSISKNLSINFSREEFKWDQMLNSYYSGEYTEEEANAVAYLMKACGYSVEMNYHPDASGTQGSLISGALIEFFKYDGNCRTLNRDRFSASDWSSMIYDNLKNVGPVVMNGQSPLQGGHSFICDGYDGKGYFHFNWGWGGVSDGYYLLDALNPDAQGIGGASGGFNFYQNAVFGAQPPTGEPVVPETDSVYLYGSAIATISGKTITFDLTGSSTLGYGNGTNHDINVTCGAIITPIDGTAGEEIGVAGQLGSYSDLSLSPNSYYPAANMKWTVTVPNLSSGKYRVTIASRQNGIEDSPWIPAEVVWGCQNSCILTVSGSNYSVQSIPVSNIEASDLELKSTLYAGKNVLLKAKFTNNSDISLTQGVCPALYTGNTRTYIGESILVSLEPGETVEKEWLVKFMNPSSGAPSSVTSPTDFTLKMYNPQNNMVYSPELKVTMDKNPGAPRLMLSNFTVPGAELIEMDVNGVKYYAVAKLNELAAIPFEFSLTNNAGYFDGVITLGIYEQDPQNPNRYAPILQDVRTYYPFLMKNDGMTENTIINFPEGVKDHLYFIYGQYSTGNSVVYLASRPIMWTDQDGVDEILINENEPAEIYNLQGVRIDNPMPGQMVIVKRGAKTEKQIWR